MSHRNGLFRTTARGALLACLATAVFGCAGEQGLVPETGPQTEGGAAAPASIHLLSTFRWERTWGVCPDGQPCRQRIEMVGAGATTFEDRGTRFAVRPRSEDFHQFSDAVTSDLLIASLQSARCDADAADETIELELGVDGQAPTRTSVGGCRGPEFDAMHEAVRQLWARYAPPVEGAEPAAE